MFPIKGSGTREVFFSLVQCNMLHSTNTRKKVHVPWFQFLFHATKSEGNAQKSRWFCPWDNGAKLIQINFAPLPQGQKVREILSHVRKQRFSFVSPPKFRFSWRDLYFLSEITHGITKKSIFICTIPLFLNCLEAVQGYRNAKNYFFICCVATLESVSGWWDGACCIAPTRKKVLVSPSL